MFVSFDPLVFLVWLFISTFIPGAMLSFSLLKKHDFGFIEKLFIGFALGFVLMPLIPLLLNLVAGVKFSASVAYASIAVFYLLAIALFVKEKAYEGVMPKGGKISFSISKEMAIPAALLVILVATYLIRFGTYSPVYQELDPYYYTYPAQQLLTLGENPMIDWTAWYPEVPLGHRSIATQSYLEATWYVLYTGGTSFNNMTLALVASMYPPLAAVLAVFFIYLLISKVWGRKWGVITAGIASFIPLFIYKLAAGEQEVQPYAFFALAFLYAMYVISARSKNIRVPEAGDLKDPKKFSLGADWVFPVMAGVAYYALAMGSNSQILALTSIILFVIIQSVLLFLRDEKTDELKRFLTMNGIFFVVGPLLGGGILKAVFESGTVSATQPLAFLLPLAFGAALLAIKKALPDRQQSMLALGILAVLGIIIYAATPLGGVIKSLGTAGFGIAEFQIPLDRTIAEQNLAATEFSGQIGFIAQSYSIPPLLDNVQSVFNLVIFIVLAIPSFIANAVMGLTVALANLALGTNVSWNDKDVSLLLMWVFLFLCSMVYCLWKFVKKEDDALFLFFLAVAMPPIIVGLVKAKYTIYAAVLLAVAVGFTFGALESVLGRALRDENERKSYMMALLGIGAFFLLFQFLFQGFAPSLLWGSAQTLYQNNPGALAPKFASICATTKDADVCAAAADPMGYASNGTNYQYSEKLCLLSVFSDPQYLNNPGLAPQWEAQAAYFRCQRLSDYWVDSMEWISRNTPADARVTSWWDYGHWINYFGQRGAVIRNDQHASPSMVGDVAHAYIDGTPGDLKSFMQAHSSQYALFDVELISGGGSLGGKYGALNYLSCARDNLTSVAQSPGESQCEAQHFWETIFISQTPCTISSLSKRTGLTAYEIYAGQNYLYYYPPFCQSPQSANEIAYCQNVVRAVPTYCVGNVTLANGQTTYGTYYLNETYPNGDLRLNKAILQMPFQLQTTSHMGPVTGATLFYTEDKIWIENGEVKSGYEDRKGKFYDSNLYRAMFLEDLPGFKLVYSSPNGGAVKIYQIANSTGQ